MPILAVLPLLACQTAPVVEAERVDTLIIGGTVYDGSGTDGRPASVLVNDGRIVEVIEPGVPPPPARETIDATGLVVAPGFIDPHTHADEDLASEDPGARANLAFAFQGVTTVVVGNDGFGDPDIARQAGAMREAGIGTNVAFLAGFGPIREASLGKANRSADANELAAMRSLAREAMCQGAWGLSTGLYYAPQNYAGTDEVIAVAREVSALGGYYDTHMRDESTYNITVEGALLEALEIGRRAQIPVHIAHIKALGPAVWGHSGKMIAIVEQAKAAGQRVTADQYPWEASGTRISNALVPRWALEGGLEVLRGRLADAEQADRIREAMIEGLVRRGGADRLLVTGRLEGADVQVGQTLQTAADKSGLAPVDAAIAILKQGDARVASFNMSAEDIAAFARQDWVVTGSDGSTGHPRKYASFSKAYRDLVTGEGAMSLARFIQRSTSQTANIIGLRDRGLLEPGFAADIVIFDPGEFAPRATYGSPRELSVGVRHLLINGYRAISDGEHTGAMKGVPLLKDSSCPD